MNIRRDQFTVYKKGIPLPDYVHQSALLLYSLAVSQERVCQPNQILVEAACGKVIAGIVELVVAQLCSGSRNQRLHCSDTVSAANLSAW